MSNFNELTETGEMELLPMGGSSSVSPQSIPDDFSSVEGIVMGDTWRGIQSMEDRIASVDSAYGRFVDQINKDKSVLVPWQDSSGAAKELPVFDPAGGLTKVGREYFDQSRAFLEQAARREDGGVAPSPFNDQLEVSQDLVGLLGKQQKQFDPLHDLAPWMQERQALGKDEEAAKSMTFQDFVEFANADVKSDEAKLDPENKELQKEWATRMQRQLYDPTKMDAGQMMDKVAGQWVLNPNNYSEIDKMEGAIQSNEDLTGSQKKRMLMDYRALVEQHAGELVNAFSAADAGVLGSIVSSPLRDEFQEAMAKPGASAYEFIKANKERFSKDSYGLGSELGAKFRDAVMATGTGALWAASLGNYTSPAEAWGGLAEDTSKAYHNDKVFSVFGVDVNRRDLTELTGQVGSFVAMGGLGAMAGKGLLKAGSTAGRYAGVAESGKYVLKSTLAAGATAEGAAVKTLGAKTLAGLKAAATDPEVYIGSLQAAGMSYGKTFNEAFERTGNREEATKAANIDAISDGLSAFIATSVMNRVAPGMGKAFGMTDDGISGGIVQNLRARALGKESMEQIGKVLDDLKSPIGADVRKAFAKDLVETMGQSAKQLGLKGIGAVGNMGAEAVEESADEMISDVIGAMLDDSKTWKEDVWANIGEKWKEYVKAGVLGAIGGGMGDVSGTAMNARQVFGKSDGYKAQEGMWDQIKTRVKAFDSLEGFVAPEVSGFKNMAEFIQADKPVNADGTSMTDQEWTQKKSQALLSAARSGFQKDFTAAVMGKTPLASEIGSTSVPEVDMGSSATEAAATPPAGAEQAGNGTPDNPSTKFTQAMAKTSVQLTETQQWRKGVDIGVDEKARPLDLGNNQTARVLQATSADGTSSVGIEIREPGKPQRILSPDQIRTELASNPSKAAQKILKDFENRTDEDITHQFAETIEPTKQGTAEPAAKDGAEAAASGTGAEQGGSEEVAAPAAEPAVKPLTAEAETLLSKVEQGGVPTSVTIGLKNTAEANGITVTNKTQPQEIIQALQAQKAAHTASLSLTKENASSTLETEVPTASKGEAEVGRTSFELKDGSVFVETTSNKTGKKYGITAELATSPTGKSLGRTRWTLSNEDSKTPGEYSGSIPMENDKARELAVKALGEDFVKSVEQAHQTADTQGMAGTETAISQIEASLKGLKQSPATKQADENQSKADDQTEAGQALERQVPTPVSKPAPAGSSAPQALSAPAKAKVVSVRNKISDSHALNVGNVFESKTADHTMEKDAAGKETGLSVNPKGEVWVSEELFQKLHDEHEGNPNKIAQAIRERTQAIPVSLDAKPIAEVAEIDDMLDQDASYVVSMDTIASGEPDSTGGTWKRHSGDSTASNEDAVFGPAEESYAYTPPQGAGLSLAVGDVVLIGGKPDEALVLDEVSNGEWFFRKVKIDGSGLRLMNSKGKQVSLNWQATKLMAGAVVASPLLEKIRNRSVTPAEMKGLFLEMVNLVAPGYKGKIVEVKFDKASQSFVQADLGAGTIKVDYVKLGDTFGNLLQHANLSNTVANEALAADVARVMGKMVDEEVIHLLAAKVITFKESNKLYKDVWKAGKDSPLFKIMMETAKERYPGIDPDPDYEGKEQSISDVENGMYSIVAETLRKLHQLSTSGSTTESAVHDSFMLQAAIGRDVKDGGNKVTKFVNMAREMLRRYSERIRRILGMRWQQGRLPADQQRVLARLNADYRKAKIGGDMDYAQEASSARVTRLESEAAEAYEEWVNEIGRENYEPLNELRQLTERFPNTHLEQLLVVTDDMRLEINPTMRALIEDYDLLDLAPVDQALAALNTDTKDVKGRNMSSYRQAMTVAFLKKQVADARLAALDPELAETVAGMIARGEGSLEKNREGLGRVMRLVMDGPATDSQKATALQGLDRQLQAEEQRLQSQIQFIKDQVEQREIKSYQDIDISTLAGRVELLKLAPDTVITEEMTEEETTMALQAAKNELVRQAKIKALHSQYLIPVDGVERATADSLIVAKEFTTLRELATSVKAVREQVKQLRQERESLATSEQETTPLDPTTPHGQLIGFLNATDDYNQYLKNILHRSLGDFFVNKEDFGVVFTDISQRSGIGSAMKFPVYGDTLPEAVSPSDVFGVEMRQQNGSIGFVRKRHFPKDGIPLTKEQIRQNQEIEVIDRKAKSNASFAGRQHFNRAYLDHMLGRFGMKEDYDLYMDTGGFALRVLTDEDSGRYRVERPQAAFQSLNMSTHNKIRNALADNKGNLSDQGQAAIALLVELEKVNRWAKKVHSTVGPKMIAEIAGRQTLAARVKLMLDDQFKKKDVLRYVDKNGNFTNVFVEDETVREVNGLLPTLDLLYKQVYGVINNYIEITNNSDGSIASFKIKDGVDMKLAYQKLNNLLWSEVGLDVQARLPAANDTVKLVRNAMKGFKDTNWRRNYEQEGSRAQRSESFIPENPELLELKHSPIDIRIVSNFLWNTRFHEKNSDYYVSGNFALEMLSSYARTNYGEGRLPELYTERKTKRFGLSDSDVAVFEATGTHPDFPQGTEMQRDVDGNPYVMVTYAEPNVSDATLDPNGIGFDNRRKAGNMAVEGETMTSIREDLKPDSSLTRAQSLEDRAGMGTNSRRYWVSQWGLAVGANSEGEFSGDAAKRFLFDIVRAEADGVSPNERLELLQRGLAGLFPAVASFAPGAKSDFFKGVQNEFLAKDASKGQASLFPSWGKKVSEETTKATNLFGEPASVVGLGQRFSAEQFLVDLAEYKAEFERNVLIAANVGTSLGDAVNAVKLSLPSDEMIDMMEETDVEEEVPNPRYKELQDSPFDFGVSKEPKTIKQTTRKNVRKQIKKSSLRHNSFASEEESTRIQEMLETMMTQPEPPIYDASLLVGGIDGVGNAFVSMLLQSLPGKTQVVSPTDKQVVKAGLQNVGLKVFIGGDGVPNLIYAPQGQSSPELTGSAAHGTIAQLLSIAVQNPATRDEIDRLGRSIEQTLDPVFLVEGLYQDLANGRATWTSRAIQETLLKGSLSLTKENALGNQPAILRGAVNTTDVVQRFEPMMKHLSSAEKRRFKKDLTTHLIKLTEHSTSLDVIKRNAGSISLFPARTAHLFQKKDGAEWTVEFDERGTTSRILLIAEIMTNPVARRYFEKAYIGRDQIETTQLQPVMERSLFDALQAIARPDSEREMFDSETVENAGESATVEQGNREDDDVEVEEDENVETTPDNPELLEAMSQLDTAEKEEAAQLGAIQGNDPKAVYKRNALGPQQDAVNTRLRELTKDTYVNENVSPLSQEDNSPSNALLFNGLARILELGKLGTDTTYTGEAPQSNPRDLLNNPPVGDTTTQLKVKPLWKNMPKSKDPQTIYVGEMQSLTIPKLAGQTAQNLAFSTRRIQRAKTALIMGSPVAYALVAELAQQHIGAKLASDPHAGSFARLDARVEVTDALIEQLQAMLPSARVEEIKQEISDSIARIEDQLDRAANDELNALAEIERLNAQVGRVQQDAQARRRKVLEFEIKAIETELARHAKGVRFVRTETIGGQPVKVAKDVADNAWLEQKNEKLAELQEELEGLNSLDHGSLTAEDYENPALRDQARKRVVEHVLNHVDILGELAADAGNMGAVMTSSLREAMANDPELRDHANALFSLLNDINGKLNLFERAQETAFLAEAVDPGVIASTIAQQAGVLMKAYNIRASILNAHIEFHARNTFRLYGMDGSKLATGGMKVKRFTIDEAAPVTRKGLAKMRQSLRQMTNGETMAKGYLDTLVKEVVSSVSGRSQASRETNSFIRSVAQAYLANPQMDLNAYVEERINTALDEEFADGFKQGLDEVAMTVGAAWDLVTSKVKSPQQLEELKTAEKQLRSATTALEKTRRLLGSVDNNDGENFVGTGYHQGEIGAPAKVDRNNRVVSAAVPAAKRNIGVNLFLVPEGMAVQQAVGESDADFESRLKAVTARWKNEATTEQRREHYIKAQAINKALGEVVENYVDDAYRMARGTEENFIEFDPFKVIMEAVDFANAEQVALNDYLNKASSDAWWASYVGLRNGAISLLTDPNDTRSMSLLTASEKASVKRIRLPDNHQERQERIGRLFEMDGESVVLVAANATQRLMDTFPQEITKRNADSSLQGIVLDAMAINPNGPTNPSGTTAPSFSYFLNGILAKKTEKFGDTSFALTADQPDITREAAAKLFHDKWLSLAQRFLNSVANQESRDKVVSLEGRVSKAAVADWGNQLQMLVMAHGDRNLKKETREQIEVILKAIDSGSMVRRDTGTLGVEQNGMYELNIHKVFAKAFSEIEAKAIQKRLIAGMAINGSGKEVRFWMLHFVHHQDARIRNRFIKDHVARETAKHLNAILDYGFNLKTGRRGYETSKKAAQEEIGKAAEKVGNNALNQTLGYMLAVVRGMESAHQMTKRQAVVEFARVLSTGFVQLEEFDKAQKEWYGNGLNRYWNGHSLDLVRDLELASKVRGVLRDAAVANALRNMQTEADAQAIIEKLVASLEASVEDGKLKEVRAYGETVRSVMTDIHNAMQFTTAMLSQEADDTVADDARQPWRDNHRATFKQTYSTVPLRLSYAVHPDPKFMGKESEGRYVSDAIDLVSFADASLFGGVGRNEITGLKKNVYRPIAINGLTGPLSMVNDALYRLNVTPTYEVLRRSFGKITNEHGLPTVESGHLFDALKPHHFDKETTPDYYAKVAKHEEDVFSFQKALAGIVSEHEVQIQNDAAINVSNTGGAEVMRFLGTNYIVRALASPMQLWDQTASPSVGYTAGKLVAGKGRMAKTYFSLVGKLLASVATDRKFYHQVRAYIEKVEPAVYYRSADGQDTARDMMGSQVRYGKNKGRNLVGKGLRKYEQLGEKALSLTIGSGERVIASAVFLTELMEELGNQNLEQVLALDADAVPMMAKNNARVKVNDLMSQSDQSKKGWLFQTRTTSPTANALLRSAVRFSNHTAGMSSNASVLFPAAIDPLLGKLNSRKWGDVDKESQQEALENVVQTLFQNVLFYPMKLKVMVPLLLMAFFKSTGDDDDEATKKAQDLTNDMLSPTDDGHWFPNAFKALVFGRERELFQSKPKKTGEAARSSALAELMTKSLLEGFQLVPGYGALAGYSPVSTVLQVGLTNPLSESAAAMITDVPRADGMYGKEKTTIRKYEKDWDENLVSVTAPTMMAHDMGKALKLIADYNMTPEAEKDRGMALFNSSAYLISELVPFAREFRSFMQGELKEPVYKEERREKKRDNKRRD